MKQGRFDRWTMLLTQSEDRRSLLKRVVSGAAVTSLAAVGLTTSANDADAKSVAACRRKCKKKNSRAARQRCRRHCATTPGPGSRCLKNSACRPAQICSDGKCTGGGACTTNRECTAPQICVNGTCRGGRGCSKAGDCINAQRCINGLCVGGGSCDDSLVCTGGQTCRNGVCFSSDVACNAPSECSGGMLCLNGVCAYPPTCPSGQENCGPTYACCPSNKCLPGETNFFCDACPSGEVICTENYICCPNPQCIYNDDGQQVCLDSSATCPDGRPICGGTTCCALGYGCAWVRGEFTCV